MISCEALREAISIARGRAEEAQSPVYIFEGPETYAFSTSAEVPEGYRRVFTAFPQETRKPNAFKSRGEMTITDPDRGHKAIGCPVTFCGTCAAIRRHKSEERAKTGAWDF